MSFNISSHLFNSFLLVPFYYYFLISVLFLFPFFLSTIPFLQKKTAALCHRFLFFHFLTEDVPSDLSSFLTGFLEPLLIIRLIVLRGSII